MSKCLECGREIGSYPFPLCDDCENDGNVREVGVVVTHNVARTLIKRLREEFGEFSASVMMHYPDPCSGTVCVFNYDVFPDSDALRDWVWKNVNGGGWCATLESML